MMKKLFSSFFNKEAILAQTRPCLYKIKNIKYIFKIIIIISVIILGIFTYSAYQDYKRDIAITNLFVTNAYSDKDAIKVIIKKMKKIPIKAQDILLNNNIKIDYETWLINVIPEYKESWDFNVAGTFDGLNSRIVLQYQFNEGKGMLEKYSNDINTFHEVGHAFDYDYVLKQYGYSYSGTSDFDNIFMEECPNVFNVSNFDYFTKEFCEFYLKSRHEYFAECFGFYLASDETNKFLYENAPKTYDYIKKTLSPPKKYTFISYLKEILY